MLKKITVDQNKLATSRAIMKHSNVALFIIAYNAEKHIRRTLQRIPREIIDNFVQIFIIDDSSQDSTIAIAQEYKKKLKIDHISIMKTPVNQGYGGNQKIGYTYAIEHKFDFVIMLHADGQYPPELLPNIIAEFSDRAYAGVFGSRMMRPIQALKGGMPFYKWLGNIILTKVENMLLGSHLSEFHSGYRAYAVSALEKVPFLHNSDDFHFDTDIIVQLFAQNLPVKEIPMPTYYGNEVCHVDGFKYAWNCIKSVLKYRLHKVGLFYQKSLDTTSPEIRNYKKKTAANTLHHAIQQIDWRQTDIVADIGGNDGKLSDRIAEKTHHVTVMDINTPNASLPNTTNITCDLNSDFTQSLNKEFFDKILALDIIEHLHDPEETARRINSLLKNGGILYASTANIAYILMRITHLLGWFNYGKRGILDNTHHRLFTISSFKHLLKTNGFIIQRTIGFGPPLSDEISSTGLIKLLDTISGKLARIYPALFAFNFLIVAEKRIPFKEIYQDTIASS